MQWSDVRKAYPEQWLVIEALEAHSARAHRIFDRVAVLEHCADGRAAMKRCNELQRAHPDREFCFVHTEMPTLEIEERRWVGIRGVGSDAARPA